MKVVLNRENINDLLDAVREIGRNNKLIITPEHIEKESFYIYLEEAHKGYDEDSDEYNKEYYKALIGLEISYKAANNQYHKSDGTEVTYYVDMKLPNGKQISFETEMCLMVGWNYCGDDIEIS